MHVLGSDPNVFARSRERVDDFDLFRTDLTQIRLTKRGIARR